MGTKIQDYDLEPSLRQITGDIRNTRQFLNTSIKDFIEDIKGKTEALLTDFEDAASTINALETSIDEVQKKLGAIEGLVGFSSAGEEDDEIFIYDPVTDDIKSHEVRKNGVLKFKIDYSYTNGNISEAVKTYMDGASTVKVTSTFTYNAKGNVSGMSHRRVVTTP